MQNQTILSSFAHDVKQPLSVLSAQLYFLKKHACADDAKVHSATEKIETQLKKVVKMIDILSLWSKSRQENYPSSPLSISVNEFLDTLSTQPFFTQVGVHFPKSKKIDGKISIDQSDFFSTINFFLPQLFVKTTEIQCQITTTNSQLVLELDSPQQAERTSVDFQDSTFQLEQPIQFMSAQFIQNRLQQQKISSTFFHHEYHIHSVLFTFPLI